VSHLIASNKKFWSKILADLYDRSGPMAIATDACGQPRIATEYVEPGGLFHVPNADDMFWRRRLVYLQH
jgi:hypothetical protein